MSKAKELIEELDQMEGKQPKPKYKTGDKVKLKHLPNKGPFPVTKSKYDEEVGEWQYLIDQKWRSESGLET